MNIVTVWVCVVALSTGNVKGGVTLLTIDDIVTRSDCERIGMRVRQIIPSARYECTQYRKVMK